MAKEYANGEAKSTQVNAAIDINSHKLDTRINKSGYLRGKAETSFSARTDGLRAVPFDLFPSLRVQQVTTADGRQLAFIQEKKEEDANYWVILPQALAAGDKLTIQTVYEGKDAVSHTGSGNYFPVARNNWYPNSYFGDYAEYDMTFATPKNLKMLATGELLKEYTEGDQVITHWKSEVPQAVAGFNFGDFKSEKAKVEKYGYLVDSYANKDVPDFVKNLQRATESAPTLGAQRVYGVTFGAINTVSMIKKPLAEAQVALDCTPTILGRCRTSTSP